MNAAKIIYSINIEDVQNVAEEHLGRCVLKGELKIIEDILSDYIDWHEAIILAIDDEVNYRERLEKI